MEKFIRVPYGSTVHGDEEIAAVVEVLNTTTQMSKNVLDFEPELALFVKDLNPLTYYISILKFADKNLKTNAKVYFEINEYLYNDIKKLLLGYGYININLKIDAFGKDRFVSAKKV